MKKIYNIALILSISFGIIGCGGDNAYDGINGLKTPSSSTRELDVELKSLYQNIILKDAESAYVQSETLLKAAEELNTSSDEMHLESTREEFKKLILSYKRVESVYVAGYNSDDMRDIADFYIEQFIKSSKSQDIAGDLDLVFAGEKKIVVNALKGITALEYTLFGDAESLAAINAKMNQNRLDAALLMTDNIKRQLQKVRDYYRDDKKILSSSADGVSALLNVLVDNSFRLRESRIGDAAGFTAKYQNNPDPSRLEYYKSSYSLEAIKEILSTHKRVMEGGLNAVAIAGSARSEAEAILSAIDEGLKVCDAYDDTLENSLDDSKTLELYNIVKNLQNNYTGLINGLNFTQDIIEADGD